MPYKLELIGFWEAGARNAKQFDINCQIIGDGKCGCSSYCKYQQQNESDFDLIMLDEKELIKLHLSFYANVGREFEADIVDGKFVNVVFLGD